MELLDNEELMLAPGLEQPHILQHRHPHGGCVLRPQVAGDGAKPCAEVFRRIE